GFRRINMISLAADYCRPRGCSSPLLKIRSAGSIGCPTPQKDSGKKHRSKSAFAWFTMRDGMISLLSIVALGFFLGMRHATDPDHVIAVTTIVSRERQMSKSAWIGAFWGIGHTLTIFVVGAAIILFGLVIPPRLGLSMELAVGVMLVVLGIVNVRSFLRDAPHDESQPVHSHPHCHGDYVHTHPHV